MRKLTRREVLVGAALLGSTARVRAAGPKHYLVLVALRGGYDSVLSVNPQDPREVGDRIHCGYTASERVAGPLRMFGPHIGGLERHDRDLCLVHGVRSDTTNHPDGIAMLRRGSVRARNGRFVDRVAGALSTDAPIDVLDLAAMDGRVPLRETHRPRWAELRAEAHAEAIEGLALSSRDTRALVAARAKTAQLERFLDEARGDAETLDARFEGELGHHLRLAFQAIRGNWARVVDVGSRNLWYDSHSDSDRFQRERLPPTFADLAAFLDLLKSTRNEHGRLFDQTTVAVYSEFGRFPRLNGERGKDHWPENSWILAGRGVRGGSTVGATDELGKGQRVDFRTGRVGGDGARPVFIDNLFATLAAIAGAREAVEDYGADAKVDAVMA